MNNLILEKTDNTPGVELNSDKRRIEFTGDSRPENAKLFFEPIFNWISEFETQLHSISKQSTDVLKTDVNFKLEYFNSSSAKYVIELIKAVHKIESGSNSKVKVEINWHYEEDDEDLRDAGKEFVRMTGIEMNFIAN